MNRYYEHSQTLQEAERSRNRVMPAHKITFWAMLAFMFLIFTISLLAA